MTVSFEDARAVCSSTVRDEIGAASEQLDDPASRSHRVARVRLIPRRRGGRFIVAPCKTIPSLGESIRFPRQAPTGEGPCRVAERRRCRRCRIVHRNGSPTSLGAPPWKAGAFFARDADSLPRSARSPSRNQRDARAAELPCPASACPFRARRARRAPRRATQLRRERGREKWQQRVRRVGGSASRRIPIDRECGPCRPQVSRWQFCRSLAELPGDRRSIRTAFPRGCTAQILADCRRESPATPPASFLRLQLRLW